MKWLKKYNTRKENEETITVGMHLRPKEKGANNRKDPRAITVQIITPRKVVEEMLNKYGACYTYWHPAHKGKNKNGKGEEMQGILSGLVEINGKEEIEKEYDIILGERYNERRNV